MKKVRSCVVGYGHLGKWHVEKALQLSEVNELKCIVESNPKVAEEIKVKYPNVKVVTSLDEIISEIDCAIVVTPTSTHFNVVHKLLTNEKHVFCEKPICTSSEEAKQLKKLADSKNLILQVGHSERFHQIWQKLREVMMNLKPPYTVRMNRVAAFKGRATDVDVIQDLMIHDIDLMLWLFSDHPNKVDSSGAKMRTKHWDQVTAHFSTPQGSHFYLTVGRNHVKEMRDLEIYGDFGTYYIDLFNLTYHFATNNQFPDGAFVQTESYQKQDHLLEEQKYFFQSVIEKKPAIVTAQDGVNACLYIESVLKSLDTHQPVNIAL